MAQIASALIAPYRGGNRVEYLDNLFRMQIVAGRYRDAVATIASLRALRGAATPQLRADDIPYEMYAKAKARSIAGRVPFATAYVEVFRETFARLDDPASALVVRALVLTAPSAPQASLRGTPLVRAYLLAETFRAIAQPDLALIAQDDHRRYIIADALLVKTPDDAKVCVTVVRPRSTRVRLTALLNFTIYADRQTTLAEARRTASNGYVGVEGLTRGKGCSPDKPVPYEHDGSDADAVIYWIARQRWSDGRVGMYGGSYEGFTQWAAAKHRPRALQALMPSVTNAPGIDSPMEGNIFQSYFYNWPLYVTAGKWLDANDEGDPAGLNALEAKWYVEGRSYRSMGELGGPPNPIWQRWLEHPSYDAYWQRMIPYGPDFAHIGIPVLTTTGYFDGGQIGALYYFNQYQARDPKAQSYLIIGPYDHIRGQRGTTSLLGDDVNEIFGYRIDPVAHIDLGELRYAWFNYVFKGAPRPAILQNKVNYEVMGANVWRHVPTVAAMSPRRIRFYLSDVPTGSLHTLADKGAQRGVVIAQSLNLADRSDVNRTPPPGNGLDTYQAVAFASAPFVKPCELSGLFSGHLDYVVNKRDFDFEISLFDRTKDGTYVPLGLYFYMARASYAGDRMHRALLVPGKRAQLDFTSGRLTSRAFAAGSRLVVLINLLKEPDLQVNYGTGKDVSDETLTDATSPLAVHWLGDSYVDVPVSK